MNVRAFERYISLTRLDRQNESDQLTDNKMHVYLWFGLTHISLASFLWDVGKQCRPRPDATEGGV